MERLTSENIKTLQPDEVVVFGSNRAGRHGAGLAVMAMLWGARYGVGEGLSGQTYALPTKNFDMRSLSLNAIQEHIVKLEKCIKENPRIHFLITKVGCGLAGYKPEQIAPMFQTIYTLKNVSLPKEFIDIINEKTIHTTDDPGENLSTDIRTDDQIPN